MAGSDNISVSNTKNYYPPVIISLPLVIILMILGAMYLGYWVYWEIEGGNKLVTAYVTAFLVGGATGTVVGLVIGFALVSGFSLFNQWLENKQTDKQYELNTKENVALMRAITDTQAKQNKELQRMVDTPGDTMGIDSELF